MQNNKYIKFRIVEKEGKFAIQGFPDSGFYPVTKQKRRFFIFKKYEIFLGIKRRHSEWEFLELNNKNQIKSYNSYNAALNGLKKFLITNYLDNLYKEEVEWKKYE